MTNKEAIAILTEELHHTEFHLQAKDKAPDYYKELGDYCIALKMAIHALIDKDVMDNTLKDMFGGIK